MSDPGYLRRWVAAQLRVRLRRSGKTMTGAASEMGKQANFLTRKLIPGAPAKRGLTIDDLEDLCGRVLGIDPREIFTAPIPDSEIAAEDEWKD